MGMDLQADRKGNFTQGSIPLHLLEFFVPFLLANLLNNLYNAVDMVIIGKYVGSIGTVAVSEGGRILMMLTSVSTGLANGGQILIAQQIGAGRGKENGRTIITLLGLLFSVSAVMALGCLAMSDGILHALNTPPEAWREAKSYFVITSAGLPLVFGYNAVSAILRGMGDSRHPLIFVACAAGLNLGLDILFITRLGMGAAGTALATVIGQGVSFFLAAFLVVRHRERFLKNVSLKELAFDVKKAVLILHLGLPLTCKSLFISVTQTIMLGYVNRFGLIQAAAYGIGDKLLQLCNITALSTAQAGSVIVAQNVGAGRHDRVKQTFFCAVAVIGSMAVVISAVVVLFPQALFGLFTSDGTVLAYSRQYMLVAVTTFTLSALASSLNMVTTGCGFTTVSMISGLLDGVVFRFFFSYLFGIVLGMEAVGFFLGNSLARVGPILMEGTLFLSGAWKKRAIVEPAEVEN